MPAATLPILVNIFVAGMFVASFLTVARLNPGFGHVRMFAISYMAGMLTPLAEFILPLVPWLDWLMALLSYTGVFCGLVLTAPALSRLYGQLPFRRAAVATIV